MRTGQSRERVYKGQEDSPLGRLLDEQNMAEEISI